MSAYSSSHLAAWWPLCERKSHSRLISLVGTPLTFVKLWNFGDIRDTDCSTSGNLVPLLCWVLSEGSISILSVCLPSVNYLIQRVRHHGLSALLTRREYASRSLSKVRLEPTSIQKQGGFERIDNRGTLSLAEDRLMPDRRGGHSVSVSAEQSTEERSIPLGQVHMRQDVNEVDERWAPI